MNEYWADKRINIHKVQIPTYVLASFSTCLHTHAGLRGFEDLRHEDKWWGSVESRTLTSIPEVVDRRIDSAYMKARNGMTFTKRNQTTSGKSFSTGIPQVLIMAGKQFLDLGYRSWD